MANILICTHREDALAELAPLLRGEHRVAVVPHVADAVRSLLLTRTDAVILDLDEAGPRGLDTLPVIGGLDPRLPILVVSGALPLEHEALVRGAGIFCLLLRPLIPGELERHLAAALHWRAARTPEGPKPNDAIPFPATG